jgi:hypothetical protein
MVIIIKMPINSVSHNVYKSIINQKTVTVQNFEIMSDKFNVQKIIPPKINKYNKTHEDDDNL